MKQSTSNFPKNELLLSPGQKRLFLAKFGVLCFTVTSVLRFALFALLPKKMNFH